MLTLGIVERLWGRPGQAGQGRLGWGKTGLAGRGHGDHLGDGDGHAEVAGEAEVEDDGEEGAEWRGQEEAEGLATTLATMLDEDAVGRVAEDEARGNWQAGAAVLGSNRRQGGPGDSERPGLKGGPDQLGARPRSLDF